MASTYHAGGEVGYGRYGNPTWEMLESAVGALEGGVATSFASGMAAVTAALDLVPLGGCRGARRTPTTARLAVLSRLEAQGRLTVRQVDLTDADRGSRAGEGADLLWVESPTNPMLKVADLAALAAAAREPPAVLAVDSTFATPLLQRPLELGADVVVHTATKYLSGHTDLLLGVVVAHDEGSRRGWSRRRTLLGAIPGPSRPGSRCAACARLHLRVERAGQRRRAGRRLRPPGGLRPVHYPGPGAMLFGGSRRRGAGCRAGLHGTGIWVHATSLGGVESSLERRRRWTA